MTHADLSYLTKSKELKIFIDKYNFEIFNYEDKIYLFSKCMTIEIYGFNIEKTLYIEIYNKDLNYNTSLDNLLSTKDRAEKDLIIKSKEIVYLDFKDKNEAFKENRQIKEKKLYLYIELMTKLFGDFLSCENHENYQDFFTPTFEINKKRIEEAKEEFLKGRKSRFLLDDEIL